MKRTLSILVFALLAAVSCVNTEEGLDVITSGRKIDSFTANIVGDNSRTISILGADGSLDIYWHSSDCLAVTDGDNIAKYILDSGECSDVVHLLLLMSRRMSHLVRQSRSMVSILILQLHLVVVL